MTLAAVPPDDVSRQCGRDHHAACEKTGCQCDCHKEPDLSTPVFEDPPAGGHGKYDAFIAAVAEHPGRWARWPNVYNGVNSVAPSIKSALKHAGENPDEWESTGRTIDGGGHGWVRKKAADS